VIALGGGALASGVGQVAKSIAPHVGRLRPLGPGQRMSDPSGVARRAPDPKWETYAHGRRKSGRSLDPRCSDRKDAPVVSFKRRWVRIGNRIGVWMYRAFDGRLASYNKDARVLMITTPGRTTGVLHSTCVRYLDTPEGLLVWGTASGAPPRP
jgi:F420H(2)-dependent quinone reductase